MYRGSRSGSGFIVLFLAGFLLTGCGEDELPRAPADPSVQAYLIKGSEARRQSAFGLAFAYADSAALRAPDSPDALFLRGRTYADLGHFAAADSSYRKVLELQPDYPGGWHNRANNAFRQQQYARAIAYYRKELATNPAARPWRGIGRSYVELGRIDSARYAFERALATDSLYAPAHFNLALLYEDEGELQEALRHARRALSLSPTDIDYRYLVGSYLARSGKNDEAIEHLLVVAEARPWHHASHYNLGQALLRTGRREQGEAMLELAERLRSVDAKVVQQVNTVQAMPTDPLAHAALGSALRLAGRRDEAMRAYKMSHHLDPTNLDVQNNIANLHLADHDTSAAIDWYLNILAQDSTFVDVWVNLGVVLALGGRTKQARRAWEHALRYEPDHATASKYLARLD